MCGIVGIVNKYPKRGFFQKDLEVFNTLVTLDTLRGKDSTGVFAVDSDGDIEIAKSTLTGSEFLKQKEYEQIERRMFQHGFAMIAHNRAATRGTITDRNAHPFWYEDKVVMVHNGTFVGDHKKHADVEVDSEALCHLLGQHDVDKVEDVFNAIHAAYACVWYDSRDTSLNIIRNDQRPLHFYDAGGCWFISSERSILTFALTRHEIRYDPKDVILLLDDNQVKLKMDANQVTLDNIKHTIYPAYNTQAWGTMVVKKSVESTQQPESPKKDTEIVEATGKLIESFRLPKPEEVQGGDTPVVQESYTFKIKTDMADTAPATSFIRYENLRYEYPTDSEVSFYPRGVIPTGAGDINILYGPVSDDSEIIAAVLIGDKDFTDLVDTSYKQNKVKIKVQAPHFLNTTTTTDVREFKGLSVLYGVEPVNVNAENICGC